MSVNDKERKNPFLLPYDTKHETIPFHLIKEEDYKPAMLEGMAEEDREIEAIVNNPEAPTFENTILALEKSGALLERVETVMGNLLTTCTSDGLEQLAQEIMPLLTEHSNRIMFNEHLFRRIKDVRDSRPQLEQEEQTLLEKLYDGFRSRGVGLPKKKQKRLQEISCQLSLKTLQFSQNVLKDTNRFQLHILNEEELAGLPQLQMELARNAAKEKGLEGWLFTLQRPSFGPILTYCHNRALRRKVYMAYNTLCIRANRYNNLELVKDIVNLRLEAARLHGHKTYARSALKHRMAKTPSNVNKFLNELLEAYKPQARKERKDLLEYAQKAEGKTFRLRPWDTGYYAHKLQLERYSFDAEMLRPYFELGRVIDGVFGLATRLYGITFKEVSDIPKYHEDVKTYEVYDHDGSFLSVLYTDFHPRANKKSGAWMTSYRGQWKEQDGRNVRPHVSLCMNLTKPTETKPALLTLGEVTTFLHEFGHGLHQMFSQCRFEALSGTNVYWDFVELPSQFMENFALEKEFLHTFAFHYETGEPLDDELIDRVIESRHFNVALGCLRQLSFCLLDMAYYTREEPLDEDIIEFEKRAWRAAQIGRATKLKTCMSAQFNHIMTGGYAAGYYSYKWAEVLDADAFAAFKEEGVFNTETAARFCREILEKGNTRHPSILYRNFRHRNPSIKAMLLRDGIKKK